MEKVQPLVRFKTQNFEFQQSLLFGVAIQTLLAGMGEIEIFPLSRADIFFSPYCSDLIPYQFDFLCLI